MKSCLRAAVKDTSSPAVAKLKACIAIIEVMFNFSLTVFSHEEGG